MLVPNAGGRSISHPVSRWELPPARATALPRKTWRWPHWVSVPCQSGRLAPTTSLVPHAGAISSSQTPERNGSPVLQVGDVTVCVKTRTDLDWSKACELWARSVWKSLFHQMLGVTSHTPPSVSRRLGLSSSRMSQFSGVKPALSGPPQLRSSKGGRTEGCLSWSQVLTFRG